MFSDLLPHGDTLTAGELAHAAERLREEREREREREREGGGEGRSLGVSR